MVAYINVSSAVVLDFSRLLGNSRTNQFADWSTREHLLNKHGVHELTSPRVGCPLFGSSASWQGTIFSQILSLVIAVYRRNLPLPFELLISCKLYDRLSLDIFYKLSTNASTRYKLLKDSTLEPYHQSTIRRWNDNPLTWQVHLYLPHGVVFPASAITNRLTLGMLLASNGWTIN